MRSSDRNAIAELIFHSTNAWYQSRVRRSIYPTAQIADIFFDTYERLDPGCGLVVEDRANGRLIGSCFYHVRPTHVSLGIMNSHPDHAGKGVARMLLGHIMRIAEAQKKALRLISSAINLDSYSLYSRVGFVSRAVYQDMYLSVPPEGLPHRPPGMDRVRPARAKDLAQIAQLDMSLLGIRRDADYRFYLADKQGFWDLLVATGPDGNLAGWMASSSHPGCNMIGPGVSMDEETALALLASHLNLHARRTPDFLVPQTATKMIRTLYEWGARNCELHFQQVLGHYSPAKGVNMPTFLPESA